MSFTLEKVVPWGRSFDEYVQMFSLDDADIGKTILGCGDGPASFNCRLTEKGGSIVSVDPIYRLSVDEIAARIDATFDIIMEQTEKNSSKFVWDHIASPEALGQLRMGAMNEFVTDFDKGKQDKRYVNGKLPHLPFADQTFDLALCSHLLFLYSEQLDLDFHLQSLRELCRVAGEVRVFPIVELGARKYRHIDKTISTLSAEGYQVTIEQVAYEFQKGGNEMLRLQSEKE